MVELAAVISRYYLLFAFFQQIFNITAQDFRQRNEVFCLCLRYVFSPLIERVQGHGRFPLIISQCPAGSIKQLSEKTGIYQADISKIERGLSNPSIGTLQRLADGMGLQMEVIFK